MKFIHCGDIHLDSRMERNLTTAQARQRNAEICATFARMAEYAREHKVTAVLIAGDLFDTAYASVRTAGFVLDTIRNALEVDFLYLRGNHDVCGFSETELPENLKVFGSKWTAFRYGDVVIAGTDLERAKWEADYDALQLPEHTVNLVTLHGQLSVQPAEERIPLSKLQKKNIDYLALGHIHGYQTGKLDRRGMWCYCGCLEGRGFDETGEKGFVLLDVENGQLKPEFVPFAGRKLEAVTVDITGRGAVREILTAAEAAVQGIAPESLVKITLTGTYTPETQKDLTFLKTMLDGRFFFLKIQDESRLRIEKETYEYDASLKGAFIRLVMASDRTEEEKEKMICWGIRALSGEGVDL